MISFEVENVILWNFKHLFLIKKVLGTKMKNKKGPFVSKIYSVTSKKYLKYIVWNYQNTLHVLNDRYTPITFPPRAGHLHHTRVVIRGEAKTRVVVRG